MITQGIKEVLEQADIILKDDPKLLKMFKQCFTSTIETSVKQKSIKTYKKRQT